MAGRPALLALLALLAAAAVSPKRFGSSRYQQARQNRILYGEEAEEGEFPAVVWIFLIKVNPYDPAPVTHFCGGSLLNQHWVLTAGHCLWPLGDKHLIGADVLVGSVQVGRGLTVPAHNFVMHPDLGGHELWKTADIGLILLDYSLTIAAVRQGLPEPVVRPERLPEQGQLFPTESAVTIVGWGQTETDLFSDVLRKYTYDGFQYIADRLVLQGGDGRGACYGDSGSPVYVSDPETGERTLAGVISSGSGGEANCSLAWHKNAVNTALYRDWIKAHTGV